MLELFQLTMITLFNVDPVNREVEWIHRNGIHEWKYSSFLPLFQPGNAAYPYCIFPRKMDDILEDLQSISPIKPLTKPMILAAQRQIKEVLR